MTSSFQDKITAFLNRKGDIFRKPLEKVINHMMEKCKYINGESLERHNWGGKPIRLNYIPTNINSPMFEKDLIAALEMNSVEGIDRPIIELLWGDIQLGKEFNHV